MTSLLNVFFNVIGKIEKILYSRRQKDIKKKTREARMGDKSKFRLYCL